MTQKVAMTFNRGWGVYNAGETAGFDADQALALETAKIAKKAKEQPKPQASIVTLGIDFKNSPEFLEATRAIEEAAQDLEARSRELDDRAVELEKREEVLSIREADLEKREAALAADDQSVIEEVDADGVVTEKAPEPAPSKPASLPKQGR